MAGTRKLCVNEALQQAHTQLETALDDFVELSNKLRDCDIEERSNEGTM
jgi:hypothetical protein